MPIDGNTREHVRTTDLLTKFKATRNRPRRCSMASAPGLGFLKESRAPNDTGQVGVERANVKAPAIPGLASGPDGPESRKVKDREEPMSAAARRWGIPRAIESLVCFPELSCFATSVLISVVAELRARCSPAEASHRRSSQFCYAMSLSSRCACPILRKPRKCLDS